MENVEFKRTGNFWIDAGIVGMWNLLAAQYRIDSRKPGWLGLKGNGLSITISDDALGMQGQRRAIEAAQKRILDLLKQRVWGKTTSGKPWWTPSASFFFAQHLRRFDFLRKPSDLVTSGHWQRGSCDFCGRSGVPTRDVGSSEDPFTVTRAKMSSFYSSLRGAIRICVFCYCASHFVPLVLFFNIRGRTMNAFLLESSGLLSLAKADRHLSDARAAGQGYQNFKLGFFGPQHPLETFLAFLTSVREGLKDVGLTEEEKEVNRVHIMRFERKGNTVTIERYYTIPNLSDILSSIDKFDWKEKDGRRRNSLQDVLRSLHFKRGREEDTNLREQLSRAFLYKEDMSPVLEEFLFRYVLLEKSDLNKLYTSDFYTLSRKYSTIVLGMDEQLLDHTQTVGDMLGKISAKSDDTGILYGLRSTRSLEEFLLFLQQVYTRYMKDIEPDVRSTEGLLSGIDGKNWRTYKSLVGIFAVLGYASRKKKGGKGGAA